jgi:hypothetical protein
MAIAVYLLCALTSALCAGLLLRDYRKTRSRLLLWSCVAFLGLAVSNVLAFTDMVVLPNRDLSIIRPLVGCIAIASLLYGLVWDAN